MTTALPSEAIGRMSEVARLSRALAPAAWLAIAIAVAVVGYPLARYVNLGPATGPWAYWPIQGALCGILFRRPRREWLTIGLAAAAAQCLTIYLMRGDLAGGATVAGAVSGVVQAALGAAIVRRMQSAEGPLARPKDFAWFVLVAVMAVPLAVTPFTALAYARGLDLPFATAWWTLFVGNSLSVLIFAPPFTCWPRGNDAEPWRAGPLEVLACMLAVVTLALLIFASPASWLRFVALPYSMFLVLAWAAARCGSSWTAIAIVILATIACWYSARGAGPFAAATSSPQDGVLALQGYLAFVALAALLLSALTEQRRSTFAQIALQKAVQDAFFESSTAGMALKDLDGRYLIVNREAASAFGVPAEMLRGRHPTELADVRTSEMIATHDRRVIERGEALTFEETLSDGTRQRRFLVTRFPVRDHTGAARFVGVIARDDTMERELQERLRQAQSVEMLGQLAAGVAHDLNNLLTVLVGNAHLLREGSTLPAEDRPLLDEMSGAATQAARLTGRLLSLGKRHTGESNVVVVDQAVRELEPLLRVLVRSNVELTFRLQAAGVGVVADSMAIEQILLNLVSNARAAISDDGRIVVETSLEHDAPATRPGRDGATEVDQGGEWLHVTVTDSGKGMDPETLARVFEPFFTTRSDSGGTGLGLYTVALLVRQVGGEVSATSAPDAGTRFSVRLPVLRSPDSGMAARA